MGAARTIQIVLCGLKPALGTALATACVLPALAQEPPLDVPTAGQLASPSSGCDAITATDSLYHHGTLYGSSNAGALYSSYSGFGQPANSQLGGGVQSKNGVTPVANVDPGICHSGIPFSGWLLYPSIRFYSLYSDNLFLSPAARLHVGGFGTTPSLTAQWTNGIHTTTIYGTLDAEDFPSDTAINVLDGQANITQQYSPLNDLTFTVLGDYTHRTIATALVNSIPIPMATPITNPTLLANGDIELPNGTIVAPNGQVVGNVNPGIVANGTNLVNPYNQYTGTATVSKIFNRGIVTLSDSLAHTDYNSQQNPGPSAFTSFSNNTVTEDASFWLGPVFYAYSDGSFSSHTINSALNPNSNAYRVVAGIGTRQFEFFRGSVYLGYQGSWVEGSGVAGGDVYGAKLSYFPTLDWVITGSLDITTNKSSQTAISPLALSVNSPEPIPISSSTRVVSPSVQSQFLLAPQWTLLGTFGYSHIDYFNLARIDNTWSTDAQVNYEIWRNLTLCLDYQFTSIVSNVAFQSANRNLITMSANYRF